jgi:hypothetical protein
MSPPSAHLQGAALYSRNKTDSMGGDVSSNLSCSLVHKGAEGRLNHHMPSTC